MGFFVLQHASSELAARHVHPRTSHHNEQIIAGSGPTLAIGSRSSLLVYLGLTAAEPLSGSGPALSHPHSVSAEMKRLISAGRRCPPCVAPLLRVEFVAMETAASAEPAVAAWRRQGRLPTCAAPSIWGYGVTGHANLPLLPCKRCLLP